MPLVKVRVRTCSIIVSQILAVFVLLEFSFGKDIAERAEFAKYLCLKSAEVPITLEINITFVNQYNGHARHDGYIGGRNVSNLDVLL